MSNNPSRKKKQPKKRKTVHSQNDTSTDPQPAVNTSEHANDASQQSNAAAPLRLSPHRPRLFNQSTSIDPGAGNDLNTFEGWVSKAPPGQRSAMPQPMMLPDEHPIGVNGINWRRSLAWRDYRSKVNEISEELLKELSEKKEGLERSMFYQGLKYLRGDDESADEDEEEEEKEEESASEVAQPAPANLNGDQSLAASQSHSPESAPPPTTTPSSTSSVDPLLQGDTPSRERLKAHMRRKRDQLYNGGAARR